MRRELVLALWAAGIAYAIWSAWPLIGAIEKRDFTIFWLAGKLALAGTPDLAYDREAFAAFSMSMVGADRAAIPYPPHILLLFAPLAALPLVPAYAAWTVASGALFLWAARPHMRGLPPILAMLTPAGCIVLATGQTGLLIGALWLWAFNGRPWAVGLLTLKPHIGFLAAFTLRRKKSFLVAAAVASGLLAVTAMLFPAAMEAFPQAMVRQASYLSSADYKVWYFQVVSPRLGYGLVGWLAFAVAAVLLLLRRFDAFTAATASMLISPYALHYDMTVACLGIGLALLGEKRPPFQLMLIMGFIVPYLVIVGTTWVAPPLILAALYAQVHAARDREGAPG